MDTRIAFDVRPGTQRPGARQTPQSPRHEAPDYGAWLGPIALALAFTTLGAMLLPHVLIAPAVALALFAASPTPMLLTWRAPDERRRNSRLIAGMLFALGVLAALFAEPASIATYLG